MWFLRKFCNGFIEWCVQCMRLSAKEHGALKVEHVNDVTNILVLVYCLLPNSIV